MYCNLHVDKHIHVHMNIDMDVYVGALAHVCNIHYAWTIYTYYYTYS